MKTTTTAQHTPGPWKAEFRDTGFGCWNITAKDDVSGVASDRAILAVVNYTMTRTNDHAGDANARLIAAAPDLLSALEYAVEAMEACDGMPGQFTRVRTILEARAAIQRATT